jgi:hypothetical protein
MVFVIVMENNRWSTIKGNTNCPYDSGLMRLWQSH